MLLSAVWASKTWTVALGWALAKLIACWDSALLNQVIWVAFGEGLLRAWLAGVRSRGGRFMKR